MGGQKIIIRFKLNNIYVVLFYRKINVLINYIYQIPQIPQIFNTE
jgi:hypothetical protein